MVYYVYILQSQKDGSFYIGQTNDIAARLTRHNNGYEKYTRTKTPWILFWNIQLASRSDAVKLERKLKSFKKRERLKTFIQELSNLGSSSEK